MTPRERLQAVLSFEIPDRVPCSPFIQEEYLTFYFGHSCSDRLVDGLKCAKELEIDFIAKDNKYCMPHFFKKSRVNWTITADKKIEKGNYYIIREIETPIKTLRQVEAGPYIPGSITGMHFSTLEYLIKDESDFAAFKKYMPKMDSEDIGFILEGGKTARNILGCHGISCPWSIGSVYNLVSSVIDVQDMMVDSKCEEDYYKEYMMFFAGLTAEHNGIMAESLFDAVGIQGNIANGAMVGNQYFDECILPYESIALLPLLDAGKPSIYHNCGCARNLYPSYKKLGITCWETMAKAPLGDNTIEEAKSYFGDCLVLCGTLDQVSFLKSASPEEVYIATAEAVRFGKPGGRYIFAASDYLEANTPIENVRAMIAAVKAEGFY